MPWKCYRYLLYLWHNKSSRKIKYLLCKQACISWILSALKQVPISPIFHKSECILYQRRLAVQSTLPWWCVMLNKWHKISAKPSFGSLTHVSLKTCEMLFIYLTASISIFICLLCWVRWKSPQTKSALGYYDISQRIINCTAGRNMTSYYRTDQFSWDHYMEKQAKK